MHVFVAILNLVPTVWINLYPHYLQHVSMIKLFGVPPIFIMKFFGELILLFLASALISYIFKIDKASRD
jgi:hypothetical protein